MKENVAYAADFERYLLTERRVLHNTFVAYKKDLEQLVAYCNEQGFLFSTLSYEHIKVFLKSLKNQGLTARTMARKVSCFKTFFNYMHSVYGFENLSASLSIPKTEKTLPYYLQEDAIEKLLCAADQEITDPSVRNKVMLYLLYASGMRISELVYAKISHLDFTNNTLLITGKGNKQRIVPLTESIVILIQEYLETVFVRLTIKQGTRYETDYLFPTFYGGVLRAVTRQSFWLYIKTIARKAGLSSFFTPHHLRHSLATHLLKRGMNIRSLQMLLGHEKIDTVEVYTHLETSHLRSMYDKKHPRS